MIISRNRTPSWLAAIAALIGTIAWAHYFRIGLVLSHYDARAHLVVARRVIDSLTPGWEQVGAVWLPLPHLIELLPVQIDFFYRTGLFGSLVSIACLATTVYAASRLILRVTGSELGAAVGAAVLTLNPNVLYLHTTPMTEPLLLATSMLTVLWMFEWVEGDQDRVPARLAVAMFAAAWTRYEAWMIVTAALSAAGYATWRRGADPATLLRRAWRIGIWPALAVAIFLINSRITVGAWFVKDGFYVPDPTYAHQPIRALIGIWWGTHRLSGYVVELVAAAGALALAWRSISQRRDAALAIVLAVFACAVIPLVAFYDGHPYRIRYMVPVVAACALFCGLAVGLVSAGSRVGRLALLPPLLAAVITASLFVESAPWRANAPMLVEAQWDHRSSVGRRAVTACLAREYRGDKILISMGSLAHYMQELSSSGFAIADFIHEGNGMIWRMALQTGPAAHAGWMLVEEVAEGGDTLAEHVRQDPAFTQGMTRICEGGGVALYKRDATDRNVRLR